MADLAGDALQHQHAAQRLLRRQRHGEQRLGRPQRQPAHRRHHRREGGGPAADLLARGDSGKDSLALAFLRHVEDRLGLLDALGHGDALAGQAAFGLGGLARQAGSLGGGGALGLGGAAGFLESLAGGLGGGGEGEEQGEERP
jgi:hypothetical protein